MTDYCLKCGKPVKAEEELCGECRKSHREFDRGRSVFFYNDKMRQSLLRYKYYGNRDYAEYYAVSLCRYMEREIRMWKPDLIVPVPMTRENKGREALIRQRSRRKSRRDPENTDVRSGSEKDKGDTFTEEAECRRTKTKSQDGFSGDGETGRTADPGHR